MQRLWQRLSFCREITDTISFFDSGANLFRHIRNDVSKIYEIFDISKHICTQLEHVRGNVSKIFKIFDTSKKKILCSLNLCCLL